MTNYHTITNRDKADGDKTKDGNTKITMKGKANTWYMIKIEAAASKSELIKTLAVKRTERGWAGHFICADRCLFRRNTLLELGSTRIVVSSVGLMKNYAPFDKEEKFTTVGYDRHFETMAFMAQRVDNRYWDADVSRQISFDSPWAISEPDADDRANDMHEAIVDELTHKLILGNIACIDG